MWHQTWEWWDDWKFKRQFDYNNKQCWNWASVFATVIDTATKSQARIIWGSPIVLECMQKVSHNNQQAFSNVRIHFHKEQFHKQMSWHVINRHCNANRLRLRLAIWSVTLANELIQLSNTNRLRHVNASRSKWTQWAHNLMQREESGTNKV